MKKYFISIIAVTVLLAASTASAQIQLPNPIGIQNIPALLAAIASYIAGIVGSIAVVVFLWAGILFLTSGIYPTNLEKGKKALIWGVVGLAIALSAGGLLVFIQQVLGG